MSKEIVVPFGWQQIGEFPDSIEALGEDIVQYRSPDGVFTVDVGWYPEMSADGFFVCRLVVNAAWERPLQEFKTRDRSAAREWVAHTLSTLRAPAPGDPKAALINERRAGLQRALFLLRYQRHRPLMPDASGILDELEKSMRYELEHGPTTSVQMD